MRDTFRRIQLPALLVAAIALLGAVPAWAELDAECVLRLAETATDEMTLAELRAQCRLPGDDAGQAPLAVSDDEVMPVEERLEAERALVQRPFTIMAHEPNYLLLGAYNEKGWSAELFREAWNDPDYSNQDFESQFQLSLKMPLAIGLFNGRMDLYGAYTNRSFWQVFAHQDSSPFRETDHEPEAWLSFRTRWQLFGFTGRIMQLGFSHQSNGRGGV